MIKSKEDKIKIIGFNDFWLRMIGILVIGFIWPFVFFNIDFNEGIYSFLTCVAVSIMYIAIYWHVDRFVVIQFRRKLSDYKQYRKRLILQSLTLLAITSILCSIIDFVTNDIFASFVPKDKSIPFGPALFSSLILTTIIISIYEAKYAFDLFKRELIQNEELKKKNAQAQLQTLKNHINPHFLFNSLNTLASIIPESPTLAVKFVENLALAYRYILEIKDRDFVSLEEELKCVEAYEYLLKIRFGENIQFTKSGVNGNSNLYVVPLSIQMLLENAVKHNVVSKSKPLRIEISADNNSISVKNNLQIKSTFETSTRTGILNIQSRYEMLTKRNIKIKNDGEVFEVILPLVQIGKVR